MEPSAGESRVSRGKEEFALGILNCEDAFGDDSRSWSSCLPTRNMEPCSLAMRASTSHTTAKLQAAAGHTSHMRSRLISKISQGRFRDPK